MVRVTVDINMLMAHETLENNVRLFKKGLDTSINDYKLSYHSRQDADYSQPDGSEYRHYDTFGWFSNGS